MAKLNIKWEHRIEKVENLKEWSKNPRKLTEEKYRKLVADIQKFGFHDVLKIDTDGTILSGHQRKRALTELGITEVGVLYPERKLTEKEMEVVSIASNKQAGTFDFDALANTFEFDSLLEGGFDAFELGFAKADETVDMDILKDSMETYLAGNVKQLTMYFTSEEYEVLLPRLDKIMTDLGVKSHTEVFLHILKKYEDTNS